MAKSKVPFALHSAVTHTSSKPIPDGSRVELAPNGALAIVQRGDMFGGAASVHTTLESNPTWQRSAPEKGWWDSVCFSRDGSRWAAAQERWEGNVRRGQLVVGETASGKVLCEIDVPCGGPITINQQGKSGAIVAISPDGSTLAWRGKDGDQPVLTVVDVATQTARSHALAQGEHDLFAHAFSDDGRLYTLSSQIAARGGTALWNVAATSVERRWDWAAGCAIVSDAHGVWSLGLNGVVWRVGAGHNGAFVSAKERRLQRARALRARATHKWDVAFLDTAILRIERDERTFCWETNTPNARWGPSPDTIDGARCFDTELLWECGGAARAGDDVIVVTDGVSVLRYRATQDALECDVLIDDTERCSPRVRRIVDVSVSGSTLAVLWKKSASATVLSTFELAQG